MGVNVNTYIFLGVDFVCEDLVYEQYEPYMASAFGGIKHYKGLCVLYDDMGSEYIYVGKVKAKTKMHESFDKVLELSVTEEEIEEVIYLIEENFNKKVEKEDIKLRVIPHYT